MSYGRDVYEEALAHLKQKHNLCSMITEERRALLREANPRFSEIDAELRGTSSALFAALRSGNSAESFNRIMEKNHALRAEREKLLADAGLDEHYLDEIYACDKCRDEYYIDGRMCDCLKKELRLTAYERLNASSRLKLTSFDDFDLGYYSEETDEMLEESPRERMTDVLAYVKRYAAEIRTRRDSLLFTGGTGLGKTHLSLAVAKEAVDAGLGVIYDSVPTLMTKLDNERFGRGDEGLTEAVCSCDLLILDDLGAEHNTASTRTFIYTIVNSRIMSALPTIISTNLSIPELSERYSDAVYSRLTGDYTPVFFCGTDIRLKKKMGIK
ncbi:MAG: ATP-binding protein [Clostridia bacterium]|nr:ATP-binding protein [Clostridia bacterium]